MFTASDPDGDPITGYGLWDTQGNGYWVVNGVVQATNAEIDITAAQLAQTSYVFGPYGSAPDTLFIKATDGTLSSKWGPGFTATPEPDQAPVSQASSFTTVTGQTLAATSLVSATDADGDTITKYGFWDTEGNGHWTVSGVTQPTNAEFDVSASNLSSVNYVAGNGTDTLFVRAYDGIAWGKWTLFQGTGSSSTQVAAGGSLELGANANTPVTFAGSTGTLRLESSTTFNGTVAGMAGSDAIDFEDIDFTHVQTPTFAGNATQGTLTVTDGTHTANISLLGNYIASTFTASSDGHGGVIVVDPPNQAISSSLLAAPHRSA
jgi:hypothetical protein